jgi:hypothetical protein
VGEEIVAVAPELIAVRYTVHVIESEAGWLRDSATPRNVEAGFPGQASCGP